MTFEEALIEHCSPTLAGVKPASLFRFCPRDSALFVRRFLALRQQFAARGLRLVILKGCRRTGSYLLYLYRERDLAEVLGRREHRDFLRAMGYTPWEAPGDCLRQLAASVWRRNSPTRSASFWAILWMMSRDSSAIRAGTTPSAAAGSAMAIPRRPAGASSATAAVPRSFAAGMRREPRSPSSSWLLDTIRTFIQNGIQKGWFNHG